MPGHTVGHIAFHFPDSGLAFTADSLMALGCGRLFEGTPDQMWQSLSTLAALPADTLVCSGHEYTLNNARWATGVDPDNAALAERAARVADARAGGRATVPSTLSEELATNPFLRAADPGCKRPWAWRARRRSRCSRRFDAARTPFDRPPHAPTRLVAPIVKVSGQKTLEDAPI